MPRLANKGLKGRSGRKSGAEGEAAHVYPGSPARAAAPGGVGGGVPALPRVLRTGDRVECGALAGNGRGSVVLTGRDWTRSTRCADELSPADGARLVRSLASSSCTGAAVMRQVLGKPPARPLPKDKADRTRAVMRWTRRVLGVPAGIRAARAAIRAARAGNRHSNGTG